MIACTNILIPVNLDSKHLSYLNKAVTVSQTFGCSRIHFLYVNDEQAGYRHPTDREDAVALKVKEVVAPELLDKCAVVYAVAKGSTAREIENYCRKESIDLIVVGHKHRGALYSAIFDSADVNIIDTVKVPVFIIPRA